MNKLKILPAPKPAKAEKLPKGKRMYDNPKEIVLRNIKPVSMNRRKTYLPVWVIKADNLFNKKKSRSYREYNMSMQIYYGDDHFDQEQPIDRYWADTSKSRNYKEQKKR